MAVAVREDHRVWITQCDPAWRRPEDAVQRRDPAPRSNTEVQHRGQFNRAFIWQQDASRFVCDKLACQSVMAIGYAQELFY